jgi:hypothetical protein
MPLLAPAGRLMRAIAELFHVKQLIVVAANE